MSDERSAVKAIGARFAFPRAIPDPLARIPPALVSAIEDRYHGLTVREYAAIAAMQGLLAAGYRTDVELAAWARGHADRLLEELVKKPTR